MLEFTHHNRVHGRKLVSVEGGDCSKRSNFAFFFSIFVGGVGKTSSTPLLRVFVSLLDPFHGLAVKEMPLTK